MASVTNPIRAGLRRVAAAWPVYVWQTELDRSPLKHLVPLLELASRLYTEGLKQHQRSMRANMTRLEAYVISVGNLTVGGTGKTPFVLWAASYFREMGLRSAILTRGYGRDCSSDGRVPHEGQTASLVERFGDEPVLLARKYPDIPVWVGKDRGASGKKVIQKHASQIILLDDGFQHLSLYRDLDLVLLHAGNPFGNGRLLPLGPLREPVEHLERCHAIILTHGEDLAEVMDALALLEDRFPQKPVFVCRHRITGFSEGLEGSLLPLEALQRKTAVAFAGIADPESFFESLRQMEVPLCECLGFPDHHRYSPADVAGLWEIKKRCRAEYLIATEKDMVRLPHDIQNHVLTARLNLDFGSQSEPLKRYLSSHVSPVLCAT